MSPSPESKQLFASISVDGHAMRVGVVGPNFGEREGPVVQKMIQSKFEETSDGFKFVVLDFSDVDFMNSSGLGSCVMIHRQVTAEKAKVVLYALGDDLRQVFKMTRMDKLFKLADDEKKLGKIIG